MKKIKFRMVAYTGAAGKYDASAPMSGNEDNFFVDDNLSDDVACHCEPDAVIELEECGLIMAVADGMGGMNAGEVASEIAVNTVRDYFAPGMIDKELATSPAKRKQYLEKLVVEADKRIKDDAHSNPEHEGMGSTIILAWIVGDQLTLTWCGDSRAYRYNPEVGIIPLSEDHSYVQDLVKQGVISYEDTFEHPQGNIITRSLGEQGRKAQPETRLFSLYNSDIILLCSDGLSGVLRDKKTMDPEGKYYPGENIEDIIREKSSSMKECREALWEAAERADWYDNVTILLCEMLEGLPPINVAKVKKEMNSRQNSGSKKNRAGFWSKSLHVKVTPRYILSFILLLLLICGVIYLVNMFKLPEEYKKSLYDENLQNDSIQVETVPTTFNGEKDIESLKEKMIRDIEKKYNDYLSKVNNPKDKNQAYEELKKKISEANDLTVLDSLNKEKDKFFKKIDDKIKDIQIEEERQSAPKDNRSINSDTLKKENPELTLVIQNNRIRIDSGLTPAPVQDETKISEPIEQREGSDNIDIPSEEATEINTEVFKVLDSTEENGEIAITFVIYNGGWKKYTEWLREIKKEKSNNGYEFNRIICVKKNNKKVNFEIKKNADFQFSTENDVNEYRIIFKKK